MSYKGYNYIIELSLFNERNKFSLIVKRMSTMLFKWQYWMKEAVNDMIEGYEYEEVVCPECKRETLFKNQRGDVWCCECDYKKTCIRKECVIVKMHVCPYEVINGKLCSECTIPDEYLVCTRKLWDGHCNCKRCLGNINQ